MKRRSAITLENQFCGLALLTGLLVFGTLLLTERSLSFGVFLVLAGLYGIFIVAVYWMIRAARYHESSPSDSEFDTVSKNFDRMVDVSRRPSEIIKPDSRFFSILTHEIRTPMTAISSSTQVLMRGGEKLSDERKQTHYENIQTSVRRIQELIDGVTLVTQSEQGCLAFNPAVSNFRAFCVSTIEQLEIYPKNSRIILDYDEAIESSLLLDENLMRHVLFNLLGNALKYSNQESKVLLTVKKRIKFVEITVSDEGIGIPVMDHGHLFESFYRASNVADIPGTGLGLNITKRAVEAHGGAINYETTEGNGTLFTVCLPLLSHSPNIKACPRS